MIGMFKQYDVSNSLLEACVSCDYLFSFETCKSNSCSSNFEHEFSSFLGLSKEHNFICFES